MLITTPLVHCTFCFISNAVCLGVKAYRFSRTSNSRKPRLSVDKFIRTKNLEQWRLNLGEKISGKAGVDYIITFHFEDCTDVTRLMSKLPLYWMKKCPTEIPLFWLFTRQISPHGVSKTLSRRYLNSTESPVPVVTQASTEWWESGKVIWLKVESLFKSGAGKVSINSF